MERSNSEAVRNHLHTAPTEPFPPHDQMDPQSLHTRLQAESDRADDSDTLRPSASQAREEASRLEDELAVQRAERLTSIAEEEAETRASLHMSRSRGGDPVDEFDIATNPIHERAAIYNPPENPSSKLGRFFKNVHQSSFLVRYFTYIVPVALILLIPILIARFAPIASGANVGGVHLLWFCIWLEIVWLTLWAARIVARLIPYPFGLVAGLFTNNAKKWRDMGKALELPATLFFWWLGIEVSFLPTLTNHMVEGGTREWQRYTNIVFISIFVGTTINFAEKIIIQLIAISFHLRTYADRIEINKFQIGSLTKLYIYSKTKIAMEDAEFEDRPSGTASGTRTPAIYAEKAQDAVNRAFAKVGDVAGTVAGDFTGKKIAKSGHPAQVILTLLHSTSGSQVLARRLYRTFVREGSETVSSEDLRYAFDNDDEAEAAFTMFDKDLNGDISMEELENVCAEIGKERKSITASLKDLDSVVSKLDGVLFFVVCVITILVFISLISTSAAGVLTSAGSAVLALSWLFSATAQEFLQSCIFVFVKHPFDVGDRVTIYGSTGNMMRGDDYFVKEIALLYTEFKKMEGHVVQAPNSYLNTLFVLNMRRSGALAEAVPINIKFGTTLQQIEGLRNELLDFVREEKREYGNNILTELREVEKVYSLTLNVVFFYKSNWQNELLRLQRRNKFICALMVALQNQGIEGPQTNQAGWRADLPFFLSGYPPPGQNPGQADVYGGPAPVEATPTTPSLSHPSILRRRAPRARGESISSIAKRVDFSLGSRDAGTVDSFSDVYEGRQRPVYEDVIKESNESAQASRRASQEREAIERRSSERRSISQDHTMMSGILRRSTDRATSRSGRGNSIV
ncbi:hypothetical protein B0A52_02527 [Exophiala mesophila]|uniref:Mechanosensitive ion channel protein n=1 Tax=Exophiala mesophila TaxID=212818 RepID=A0A438NCY3_EXOME|nr:hypothetical protein B0A52_02527 [Exophiala mesophila]